MNKPILLPIMAVILITYTSFGINAEEKPTYETTLRGSEDLLSLNPAPDFRVQEQSPNRRVREYPMQPPTIPHAIEGYIVTREMNQCLMCHGASIAPQMKAPAVAVSHYQNRAGVYLMDVSPRRYFCTQCHVPQATKPPLLVNTFRQ